MESVTETIIESEKIQKLNPLRAIRKYCLWCCNDISDEVRECPVTDCPLYSFRFNRKPEGKGVSTLKAIRGRCLDCSGYVESEVRNCWNQNCELYSYRMGHNPKLKGKLGNLDALRKWRESKKS